MSKDITMNLEQRSVRFFIENVRKQLIVNEGPRLFTVKRTKNLSNAKGSMKELLEMTPRNDSSKNLAKENDSQCRNMPSNRKCTQHKSIIRIYAFDAAKLSR